MKVGKQMIFLKTFDIKYIFDKNMKKKETKSNKLIAIFVLSIIVVGVIYNIVIPKYTKSTSKSKNVKAIVGKRGIGRNSTIHPITYIANGIRHTSSNAINTNEYRYMGIKEGDTITIRVFLDNPRVYEFLYK
jgi:hypothetical protein